MQILALPVILSVASMYIFKRLSLTSKFVQSSTSKSNHGLSSILTVNWLLVSFWILGLPHLIPAQASDWFLFVIFISVFSMYGEDKYNKQLALAVIFTFAVIVKTWTVITYHAEFSSHITIWLELIGFIVTGIFILLQSPNAVSNKMDNFVFAILIGVTGLTALISGSITISLLCFSLASIILTAAVCANKQNKFSVDKLMLMLAFLLLLHVRQYAEASLFSFALLFSSFSLLFQQQILSKIRYLLIVICMIILAINLVVSIFFTAAQPYY